MFIYLLLNANSFPLMDIKMSFKIYITRKSQDLNIKIDFFLKLK